MKDCTERDTDSGCKDEGKALESVGGKKRQPFPLVSFKQPDVLPGRTNGGAMEIAQRQEPEVLR